MRALIISDETREKVEYLRAFASNPANYYIVGQQGFSWQRPPGDDPRHVAHLPVGYRCVFSVTKTLPDGKLWRHLSISVPVPGTKYPSVFAAWTIAELFGFTGWDGYSQTLPEGWFGGVQKKEHAIILMQEFPA